MLCRLNDVQLDWPCAREWILSEHADGSRRFNGFDLHSALVYWLRGSNGVGKSTWLRVVSGLLPSLGKVDWSLCSYQGQLKKGFYVLSPMGYAASSTVSDLVSREYFIRTGFDLPELLLSQFLNRFSLLSHRDTTWQCLSSGQKKALQLSSLCYADRLIWILDEPFVYLDSHLRVVLLSLIQEHIQLGGTVLIVSHSDFSCEHRSVFLSRGGLLCMDS
ncbi:MAG: ATP-binding cassette domain-containing protein [Pseudomonadota bacterium]|nr:ATP-binding cassette domain-containing protein [Pseudomonadota bacterium]